MRDDEVLASLEVAEGAAARRRGLLGRDSFEGALLFENTRSVHSLGMRFPMDVAFCDADLVVIKTMRSAPPRNGSGGSGAPHRRGRGRIVRPVGTLRG